MCKSKIVVLSMLIGGCAPAINQINSERYYEAGLQAESQRNWVHAREMYFRSLVNAKSSGASPEQISAATFNLGRMVGYTCDYPQAESLLKQSVDFEKKLVSPNPANLTKRWSELARLTYDMGKYSESAQWYALSVPELERMGVVNIDPIGFADYLEAQGRALEKSGQSRPAAEVMERAGKLRAVSLGKSALFVPVEYSSVCAK